MTFGITTEISGVQMGFGAINSAFKNFFGCVYGRNCGGSCTDRQGRFKDNLDKACLAHDKCLTSRRVAWNQAGSGVCHRTLAAAALAVYNKEKKCSWWQVWCWENSKVEAAWTMNQLFKYISNW